MAGRIRLGGRGKAVRALAQEDLVGVDLEDLRLGELLLKDNLSTVQFKDWDQTSVYQR